MKIKSFNIESPEAEAVPGLQIAYYAFDGAEAEYGFVTSVKNGVIFCRFWRKGEEGRVLRTTSCSESVMPSTIVAYSLGGSIQDWINLWIHGKTAGK